MELISQLSPLIVGILSSLLIQGAKKAQSIDVWKGDTAKLRILLGILVFLGTALNAALEGNLADLAASDQVNLALEAILSAIIAHLTYKFGLK